MEMPDASASSETLLDTYGEYHLTALGAEPQAEDIEAMFSLRQSALRDALRARESAERLAQQMEALKVRAETEVENKIREIELMVLGVVNKKRDLDPYAIIFPKKLTGALKPSGAAQAKEGHRIANLIAPTEGDPVAGLPGHAEGLGIELRALCVVLEERVKADEAAEEAVKTAWLNELSERRRWREQYRKDHGLLTALFPLEPRMVESFFKKPSKRRNRSGGGGGGEG